MATFRVGQRVRVIADNEHGFFVGREGTVRTTDNGFRGIRSNEHLPYEVLLDGDPPNDLTYFSARMLVPLTDPKADEFIESIKRWGPLHEEPKVEPVQRVYERDEPMPIWPE